MVLGLGFRVQDRVSMVGASSLPPTYPPNGAEVQMCASKCKLCSFPALSSAPGLQEVQAAVVQQIKNSRRSPSSIFLAYGALGPSAFRSQEIRQCRRTCYQG